MSYRKPYTEGEAIDPADRSSSSAHSIHEDEKGGAIETARRQSVLEGEVVQLAEKLDDQNVKEHLAPIEDLEKVIDKIDGLTIEECRTFAAKFLEDHDFDYNIDASQRSKLQHFLNGPLESQSDDEYELAFKSEVAILKYYSPYPEVRAVTTPDDDENILCETIRAHLLGYLWACVAQFINSLFNSRFPNVYLTSTTAQVLLYPCGKFLAWALPDWGFKIGGTRHSLNPGPWTYKEQVLSTVIINVSVTSAYVFWNIQTQEVYYLDKWLTPGYKILLLLATQMMGLGFAGLLRRFAVYPMESIWPTILPTLALNRALLQGDKKETIHGWKISMYKFFWICFAGMIVYFWLPGYLFQALSLFSWMTWIAPNNFNLAIVTGSQTGLGFNPISSFDWNTFSTNFFPLTYPFYSYLQQYIGQFIGGLVILALYYTNTKDTGYLPINSSRIFDNTGSHYNITKILVNDVVDEDLYKAYSPPYYAAGNLVVYSIFFLFYPFTMVFVLLDSGKILGKAYVSIFSAAWQQMKRAGRSTVAAGKALGQGNIREAASHLYHILDDETSVYDGFDDIWTNMARKYPEVPDWWFAAVAFTSFIFAIVICTVYTEMGTPVWTIFFVIGLNLIFLVPSTYLYSISGTTEGLNVLAELIVGYALPGRPEALMFVKAFGYNITGQADYFVSDLKMGLYAKIPPRAMYRGQMISAFITAFVAYGVVDLVDGLDGICTPDQTAKFTCANGSSVYFSASVFWGAIGPARVFGQIYPVMKYAFLLGFLLAPVWWGIKRYGPTARQSMRTKMPGAIFKPLDILIFTPISYLKQVHPSLILNGFIYWAPVNLTYTTSGLYMSMFFMYYVRRYKTAWFEKYNYVLAAALIGGVALSALIIFFSVQYNPVTVSWWGNDVLATGVDGGAADRTVLLMDLPEKGYFGLDTWE
nr:hypothetical protein B0A51_03440 [Rachicladosporium sp. CCFEE 5018]